jgi:hypothetical protein
VQALQGFFHSLLPVPAVLRLDSALQCVEVALAVGVLVDQRDHVGDRRHRRLEHGGLRFQGRFLGDVSNAQPLLQLQRAVVGLFQAGEDFQQGRLAGAVAADQADALGDLQREIGVIEQRHVAEGQLRIEKGDEGHEGRDYPVRGWSAPSIPAQAGPI